MSRVMKDHALTVNEIQIRKKTLESTYSLLSRWNLLAVVNMYPDGIDNVVLLQWNKLRTNWDKRIVQSGTPCSKYRIFKSTFPTISRVNFIKSKIVSCHNIDENFQTIFDSFFITNIVLDEPFSSTSYTLVNWLYHSYIDVPVCWSWSPLFCPFPCWLLCLLPAM